MNAKQSGMIKYKRARSAAGQTSAADSFAWELTQLSRAIDAALIARAGGAALAAAAGLGLALTPAPASAATFTVNSTADPGDGTCDTNECTLREAIAAANASAGADTVDASGISGTITLNGMEISITDAVTIAGPGSASLTLDADNTADGQGESRHFSTLTNPAGAIGLSGMTLINGYTSSDGGAIHSSNCSLALNDIVANDNVADEYGGAVYCGTNYGPPDVSLQVSNSSFENNRAQGYYSGGAIYAQSDQGDLSVDISNSTLSGNYSANSGGALDANSNDGNITLTIGNTILTGNDADNAGGALYIVSDDGNLMLTISNSTLSGNYATDDGGAVYAESEYGNITLDLNNVTLGNNVAQSSDGGALYVATDLGDVTVSLIDSSLTDNYAGSNGGGLSADTDSQTSSVTLNGTTISGNEANATGGGFYVDEGTITLTDSTVSGNEANRGGGFYVDYGDVTLTNSSVTGNTIALGSGGGFYVALGNVTVADGTITGNTAGGDGGGFYLDEGNATLTNSTLTGNTAGDAGGGFYVDGGVGEGESSVTLTNSTIAGNTAEYGGGFYVDYGNVTLTRSTVSGNDASDGGGGFYVQSGSATLTNSTISENTAGGYGGGFYVEQGNVTLTHSTVSGNDAANSGGGFHLDDGGATLANSILANNTAPVGPAAYVGGTVSGAYTLVEAAGGGGTGLSDGTNGNIVGADPRLGPLANNAGSTLTHAIDATSPVFNAGDPNFTPPPNTDQRGSGFPRVFDGRLDMGSYEFQGTAATPAVSLSLSGSPFAEAGGVAAVTATLSMTSGEDVTVDFGFAGTATLNTDFTLSATQIVIPAGSTSGSIDLTGVDDTQVEGTESVQVNIANVSNAQAGNPDTVTGEITDDDQVTPTAVTVTSVALGVTNIQEESPGNTSAITVRLDAPAPGEVTVNLGFSGQAQLGNDFNVTGNPVVIPQGQTTGTAQVTAAPDNVPEGDELFRVFPQSATCTPNCQVQIPALAPQDQAIIIDDDQAQVTVTPIPALGPLGLLLLPLLIPIAGWRYLRKTSFGLNRS